MKPVFSSSDTRAVNYGPQVHSFAVLSGEVNFLNHTKLVYFRFFYPTTDIFLTLSWLGCGTITNFCTKASLSPTQSLQTNVSLPLVSKFRDDRSLAAVLRGVEFLILN